MKEQLKMPDYVARDDNGVVTGLLCKICGAPIARTTGGRFTRLTHDYAELEILFEDGNRHITCICTRCLPKARKNPDILDALYEADIADMVKDVPNLKNRKPKGKPFAGSFDTKHRGIP
jgi:hypothetical protein